ncbi:MAG: BamA/TamA family outer membrane protein [Candidatus Krumholzibacteriia bacterium]
MGRPLLLGLCLLAVIASLPAAAQDPVLARVEVEGNTRTDRAVIDRIIDVQPGDPFPLEAFDRVWDRLEDCGYFAFVDLDTEEDDQGNVTLLVRVEEERTLRGTPYVRYDRRHKYLLGAAVADINLRGKGEVLEVRAIGYRVQRGEASWTKPWFLGRDGLSLGLAGLWEQGAFVWRPFDYARWHALMNLRQDLGRSFFVELGGGREGFRQKDAYRWWRDGTITSYAAATRNVWQLRALVGFDTRDNPFYPEHGVFTTFAWTRRTGDLADGQNGLAADLRAFQQVLGKPILALRAHGQSIDRVGAEEYVLRWGGPETVRGARYAGREGDTAYLLTAEVRWPLFMMPVAQTGETVGLGLHAFTDVGDAWFEDGDPRFVDSPLPGGANRAWLSFGAGAHLNLLTWQLRFEAAKERDGDWTFEFMDVFNF